MTYPEFLDPIALHIGPFPLRWYSLSYIVGIGLAWWYGRYLLGTPRVWEGRVSGPKSVGPPISRPQLDDLIFWITLGVILGGRVGYILFYQPQMLVDPLSMLTVWEGGLSFHGGFLGVTLAGLLYARKHKVDAFRLGDLFAVATPIAIFMVRMANFANAELYGRVTDSPLGMRFPVYDPPLSDTVIGFTEPRYPSQLFEAGLEGIVLFALLALLTWRLHLLSRPGAATGIFIAGYAAARIFVENFREPDEGVTVLFGFLTRGMLLSVPMLLVGLWLLNRAWRIVTPSKNAEVK